MRDLIKRNANISCNFLVSVLQKQTNIISAGSKRDF